MSPNSNGKYQWQNPHLRKTIYPFREKKLRDFLLIYYEIDLWEEMRSKPVDSKAAAALIKLHTDAERELAVAKLEKDQIAKGLKALKVKHREVFRQPDVRTLRSQITRLKNQLAGLESTKKMRERQLEWYEKFAPDHPYHEKWKTELEELMVPYNNLQKELKDLEAEYNKKLSPFEAEAKALKQRESKNKQEFERLKEQEKDLPPLGRDGTVNQRAAARWLVYQFELELRSLDHDELLARVLRCFDEDPDRFPKWLQYMVIHFSGMRYRSAHGSWADPRELLEMVRLDDIEKQTSAQLEPDKKKALAALKREKLKVKTPIEERRIDNRVRVLGSANWRKEVVKYKSAQVVAEVARLSDKQVLRELKSMKSRFPGWAWKEIVSRTDLRLEVTTDDWEELSREERLQRWKAESSHWREIMNTWERKDITSWRKEHGKTLELIVTRAVCNEIAEHIQHLRGVKPAAGLTAKPQWYINQQRLNPDLAYLKKPTQNADLRRGASILFLGWTSQRPNAWQIARPLPGIDLLPAHTRPKKVKKKNRNIVKDEEWRYQTGGTFERTSRPLVKKKVPIPGKKGRFKEKNVRGPLIHQWLRWTHEATVVEVADLTDGTYVLTFETGQIGLNLRPLRRMTNHWDIYVGYVSPAETEPENLDDMLDRKGILPPVMEEPLSFGIDFAREGM